MDSSSVRLTAVILGSSLGGMVCGALLMKGSYDHKIENLQTDLRVLKTQKEEQAREMQSIQKQNAEHVKKLDDALRLTIEDEFVKRVLASLHFKTKLTDWFNRVDQEIIKNVRLQIEDCKETMQKSIIQIQNRDSQKTIETLISTKMAERDKLFNERFTGLEDRVQYLLVSNDELSAAIKNESDGSEDVSDDESDYSSPEPQNNNTTVNSERVFTRKLTTRSPAQPGYDNKMGESQLDVNQLRDLL